MPAYYNETDAYAAAWLRNLIAAGHIAPGVVDERSIEDVTPLDLLGYTQVHFFAGIGVWSYALRVAGFPDSRSVWSGSCPCQPFSAAGKGGGFTDERHLWPAWHHLIRECRPSLVFGEQVASKDGLSWLDLVHSDMEATGYAFGAFDLCAAGVGAPHIRQRLYFVANAANERWQGRLAAGHDEQPRSGRLLSAGSSTNADDGIVGHTDGGDIRGNARASNGAEGTRGHQPDCDDASTPSAARDMGHAASDGRQQRRPESSGRGSVGGCGKSELANSDGRNASAEWIQRSGQHGLEPQNGRPSAASFWHDCDWLPCTDGKARPVEPGTFPLAHGVAGRVGRLRAYGNAIVAPLATEFVRAYLECQP